MIAPPPEWPTSTTGESSESMTATTASMWSRSLPRGVALEVHHHARPKQRRPRLARIEAVERADIGQRRRRVDDVRGRPRVSAFEEQARRRWTEVRQRDQRATSVVEHHAGKHAAGQRQRGVARRVMNRAQVTVAFKESARTVGLTRGMALRRERTAHKPKRVNTFPFRMIKRNRPSRAAACAGMAAAVRRMKAQTLGHSVFNHRNADYRTVASTATDFS